MAELLLPPGFLSWVSGRGVSVGMSLFPSIFVVTPPVSQVESFSYNFYDWAEVFKENIWSEKWNILYVEV